MKIISLTKSGNPCSTSQIIRASLRKHTSIAVGSVEPLTPHDRLLLARMHSVDNWVVPELFAWCKRITSFAPSDSDLRPGR